MLLKILIMTIYNRSFINLDYSIVHKLTLLFLNILILFKALMDSFITLHFNILLYQEVFILIILLFIGVIQHVQA